MSILGLEKTLIQRTMMVAVVLAMLSSMVLFTSSVAWAASLTVSPAESVAGGVVSVSGGGFAAELPIVVCWGAPSTSCTSLGSTSADGEGGFSTSVTVPSDAAAGDWTVGACQTDPEAPGTCVANASGLVSIPAPVTTTTSTTSTTTTTPPPVTTPPPTSSSTSSTTSSTTSTTTTTTRAPTATATPTPTTSPPQQEAENVEVLTAAVEAFEATSTTAPAGDDSSPNVADPTTTTTTQVLGFTDPFFAGPRPGGPLGGRIGGLNLTDPVTFWSVWLGGLAASSAFGILAIRGLMLARRRRAHTDLASQ